MAEEEKKKKKDTPYDALTKRLADHFAPELLVYLNELEELKSCEAVGGEVEITHRLSDRFWKVIQEIDEKEHTFLMHIEFESSYDANIGRRLGVYGWGLFEKEGLPVRQLVWWVGGKKPSGWPEGEWHRSKRIEMSPGGVVTGWHEWREVWLPGGFEAEEFIREAPSFLLPFAAKMEGINKSLLGELRDAIIKAPLSEGQRQDLLVMAIFFASKKPDDLADVMEIFDMSVLEQNPLAQHLIEQGLQEGLEQGTRKKALEVAKKMLAQGFELETIRDLTELSVEELEALQSSEIKEP